MTITNTFANSYSKYYWIAIIGFDGKYIWTDRRSTEELRNPYGFDVLEYPWGGDREERCAWPVEVCPYCRKTKPDPGDYYTHPFGLLHSLAKNCINDPTTYSARFKAEFETLYEASSLTRYTYKNCGCIKGSEDEYEHYAKIRTGLLWECIHGGHARGMENYDIYNLASNYADELQAAADRSRLAKHKSEKRKKQPLGRSALNFFQTTNAAAQITKHLINT